MFRERLRRIWGYKEDVTFFLYIGSLVCGLHLYEPILVPILMIGTLVGAPLNRDRPGLTVAIVGVILYMLWFFEYVTIHGDRLEDLTLAGAGVLVFGLAIMRMSRDDEGGAKVVR